MKESFGPYGKSHLMKHNNRSESLARTLRQEILRGKWPVGSALPSTRELAKVHNVSPNTVHGVLRELSAQGLVDLQPRRGRFVLSNELQDGKKTEAATQVGIVRPIRFRQHSASEDEHHEYWGGRIVAAIEEIFISDESRLTLLTYDPKKEDWPRRILEQVEQMNGDLMGLICFSSPGVESLIKKAAAQQIPCVTVNRPGENATANFVTADNMGGGRLIGKLFLELGFRHVVLLGSYEPVYSSSFEKISGVVQAYVQAGHPLAGLNVLKCELLTEDSGYAAMSAYLKQHGPPEGIFCVGDYLAIGATRACQDAGFAVPEDVSIVGSTGTDVGAFTRPQLTTLAQPMNEMGRRAALMLLRMIREDVTEVPGERIPGKLLLRESLRTLSPDLRQQLGC